jgi:2-haloacid dehalogenase
MVAATAVVFDLGGVLIDWSPEYLYRKLIPDVDERREFLTTICTPQWNHEMDEGRSVPEAVAALAGAHAGYGALVDAWWTRWSEMLGGEVPGTRPLVEAIARTGRPLYALTNWSAETWPRGVQQYPFLEELFDGIVVSGQERIAKPDPRLFEILNDRFGLDPHSTVYIDDSPVNIVAASRLGYITHLFTTADLLHAWLTELGLLAAP